MRSATTQDLLIARIRVRARLLARWMERLWAEERSSPDQGLVITAGEVERLLEDPAQAAAAELRFRATDPACVALAAPVAQADAALAADACWSGLCDAFGLATAERDFLNLVLAAELDYGLQRVIAYLHDDTRKIHPTPWLAARLFDTTLTGAIRRSTSLRGASRLPMPPRCPACIRAHWSNCSHSPIRPKSSWSGRTASAARHSPRNMPRRAASICSWSTAMRCLLPAR
jgi:hypothetical protein